MHLALVPGIDGSKEDLALNSCTIPAVDLTQLSRDHLVTSDEFKLEFSSSSRAEQCRFQAERSQAKLSQAEPSQAEPSRAEPSWGTLILELKSS